MRDLCFSFSIVKYIRGPSCAHCLHMLWPACNTNDEQHTIRANDINVAQFLFFSFIFPLYFQLARHLDRAFGWAQSKSRTCMNLRAAATRCNNKRNGICKCWPPVHNWQQTRQRERDQKRQTDESALHRFECRTKTCRRSSLNDTFCSRRKIVAWRGEH